eukprot:m.542393 g.542393  ORF g.542393 m.542393 type:complete len:267 (+) comp22119_c0_seq3:545-1345(+)
MVPVSPFRTRGSNVPRARCKSALVIGVVFCVLVLVEIARDRCMTGNERNYASNGTQKHTQMLTSHYPTVPVAPNRTTETATQATTQVEEKRLHGLQGATMSLQALQQKRWSLDSGFGGDVSDTCADVDSAAIASGETVLQKLCQMEMEEILPHASGQPKTLLVDTAFINHKSTKYYLNRDGDAWKLTYGNAGFKGCGIFCGARTNSAELPHKCLRSTQVCSVDVRGMLSYGCLFASQGLRSSRDNVMHTSVARRVHGSKSQSRSVM